MCSIYKSKLHQKRQNEIRKKTDAHSRTGAKNIKLDRKAMTVFFFNSTRPLNIHKKISLHRAENIYTHTHTR